MTPLRLAACALALAAASGVAACEPPQVSTAAQELVFTTPANHDFGSLPIGATSAPAPIVVAVAALMFETHTITDITEECADFSLDLSMIALPAEISRECGCLMCAIGGCTTVTQQFDVTFSPTIAGPQSCTITITMTDAVEYVTVSGTGEAPPHDLTLLTPLEPSLAFGDVVVGQISSVLAITIRSDGTQELNVSDARLVSGDVGQFTVGNGGPGVVLAGESHTYSISCTPTGAGPLGASFQIDSDDGASPLPIALTCNGIVSDLAISPSPIQFSETFVGQPSIGDAVLQNTGSAAMVVDSISVTPAQFAVVDLAGTTIVPNATAVARITFTPDDASVDSDVQGTLTVTYDGTQTRTINLIAPVRSAVLSVTPGGEVDFGTVCGGQSASRLFAALNLGTGRFELTSATVAGTGFALTREPPSYPAILPPLGGGTATFEVTAMPPTGDATGTLALTSSVPDLASATVLLRATGQADGVAATPTAIEFDTVALDQSSGGRGVRLTNCDDVPLDVTGVTITGRDAVEFSAVSDLRVPGAIPAFGGATWLVQLSPRTAGDKLATLELVHGAGVTLVALTGQGAGDLPDDDGRGSYYACDAGGAPGTAPLALVLVLLLAPRPRRRAA